MHNMKKTAPFFVLTAGILWGMMGIYVRRLNDLGFTTIEIVTVRSVMTAVLLLVVLFFYKKEMLKIRLKDVWCFLELEYAVLHFLITVILRRLPLRPYRWRRCCFIQRRP